MEREKKMFQQGKTRNAWWAVKIVDGIPSRPTTPCSVKLMWSHDGMNNNHHRFETLITSTTFLDLELHPRNVEMVINRPIPNKALVATIYQCPY